MSDFSSRTGVKGGAVNDNLFETDALVLQLILAFALGPDRLPRIVPSYRVTRWGILVLSISFPEGPEVRKPRARPRAQSVGGAPPPLLEWLDGWIWGLWSWLMR